MKFLKKYWSVIAVTGLFALSLFLRTYRLPEFIAYHQDQVRDLVYIKNHIDTDSPILLGPKASVGNFYLAPLWYYLMTATYFFSHSPVAPAFMVALLNSLTVILLYFFSARYFNQTIAFTASLLYAVSPFSIEYSRFAWNPNPIPFFTILALFSLYIYLYEKRGWAAYLAVTATNFTFQLHYQGFLLVAAVFLFLVLKKDWKRLVVSSIIFMALLSPFLYYEIINGYSNIGQIVSFINRTAQSRSLGINNSLKAFTQDYPEFISRVLFFGYRPLGLIFSLVTYALLIKKTLFEKAKKIDPERTIYLVLGILLLTLFAYRQWIIPYYLLVALIPLILVTTLAFGRFKWLLISLALVNLILSPAFSKTNSSLAFFEKSVNKIERLKLKQNCVTFQIDDSDLKFASNAVSYLADYHGYDYQGTSSCTKNLVFCQNILCDKIKGVKKLESDSLGLTLIEK